MTVRLEILILLVILLPPQYVVTNATHSEECGEKNLIGLHGILTSPNYPNQYPEKTNCSWFLKTSNNTTATIIITNLDIEEDCQATSQKDCCKNNALIISNDKLCSKQRYPPRITSTSTIEISFTTSKNPQRRNGFRLIFSIRNKTLCEGYDLSCLDERNCYNRNEICDSHYKCADHSDEINCGKCPHNEVSCNNHSNFCFDPLTQRCDGIYTCPGGEDELDCFEMCPKRFQCENNWGCYTRNQTCDNILHCADFSDEQSCTKKLCGTHPQGRKYFLCKNRRCIEANLIGNEIDDCGDNSDETGYNKINFTALVVFSTSSLSIAFVMIICRWFSTRRNIHHLMEDLPVFPLPPFRGPGESDPIVCNYSQADFNNGGQIYEAFVQTRRRMPDRVRRTVSTPTQREQEYLRDYNPSCPASALASLGIPSESCIGTSRERFGCAECDFCKFVRDAVRGYSTSTGGSSDGDKLDDKTKEVLELYLSPNTIRVDRR